MTDSLSNPSLLLQSTHWAALAISLCTAFVYFRNLGDITQVFLGVKRSGMIFAIRHEYKLIAVVIAGTLLAGATLLFADAGIQSVFIPIAALNTFLIAFPYVWLHWGLRNQQNKAKYYSIEEAKDYLRPEESVIVLENGGVARAHADNQMKRNHLAGSPEGLGGENVIMTYCMMSNSGVGFKPEIKGEKLDLEVIAQVGNNLIVRDNMGEPIQQLYGTRECDGRYAEGMEPWPTFRMSFRAFEKAYPEGEVFLNKIVPFRKNPLLFLFDHLVEIAFCWIAIPHYHTEDLLFKSMDVEDPRLRRKVLVWGFDIGRDSVAYTEEFIRENDDIVNVVVGGRQIVVAYDAHYESVGVWYNDSGVPVTRIDFWGESDQGKLKRVETVKAGLFWCVWINYFPESDLNRVGEAAISNAA